jgi:hypothetical protein
MHKISKSSIHLKILDTWRVTWSEIHTKDLEILGVTAECLFATAAWPTEFVHPLYRQFHK